MHTSKQKVLLHPAELLKRTFTDSKWQHLLIKFYLIVSVNSYIDFNINLSEHLLIFISLSEISFVAVSKA